MLPKKPSYFRCLSLAALLGIGWAQPARGQEAEAPVETPDPGEEYRDDARRLATEAATHYDAGEYELALDLFLRAGRLYDAPTLKFWQARCLEQMGRLVDAEARYAEVARTRVEDDAPEAFLSAQRDSEAALAELRKRLPTITIVIHRAKDISKVELDGRVLPPPLVGAPVAVDPGTHVIKVTRSSGPERVESVAIVESQAQVVHVNFEAPKETPLVPIMTPAPDQPKPTVNWGTTLGVSSLVLGTVGIGVGVFAGVKAMDKHQTLEESCAASGECEPAFHEDLDSFHTWRTVSTVGYAVGIVGVGTGTVLLLLGDDDDEPRTALQIRPDRAVLTHLF